MIAKFLLSWLALCISSNAGKPAIFQGMRICSSSFLRTLVTMTMMTQVGSLTGEHGCALWEPVWRLCDHEARGQAGRTAGAWRRSPVLPEPSSLVPPGNTLFLS